MTRFKFISCSVIITCILFSFTIVGSAQFFDSLQVSVGLEPHISSKNYQPFWLVSNQFGTVANRQTDLTSFLRISNKHVLAEHESTNDRGFTDYDEISLSYGLSIYNNNHFNSTFAEEAYMKLEYKNWSLRAGRFEETTGDIDRQLSTGSLGISGNALPIPKIGIAVTDYKNVPFTAGWLQFKGTFAHGWLGDNRYAKNSYYHEKTFFLRVGPRRLKFYAGIEHFAEWGGTTSEQQFDRSLKGFRDVLFAKEAQESSTVTTTASHGGDQRGVLDGGLYWENDNVAIHGYLQKPFEGKQDISPRNKNMLAGFSVSVKDNYIGLQKILFEIISTKAVNDHIPPSQRESYYNNNIYKTGWEYNDNVIGTPLFTNRVIASNYFPDIQPFDWNSPDPMIPGNANIINNRIFGIHLGTLYSFSGQLDGKTLVTYTKNYGSLGESDHFAPYKNQFYGLQQFSYDIPNKNLTITAGIGIDIGQLTQTTIGGLIKIEWNIFSKNTDDLY